MSKLLNKFFMCLFSPLISIYRYFNPQKIKERFNSLDEITTRTNNELLKLKQVIYLMSPEQLKERRNTILSFEKSAIKNYLLTPKGYVPDDYDIFPGDVIIAVKMPSMPSQSKEVTAIEMEEKKLPAQTPEIAAPDDDFIDPEKLEKEAQNADKNRA